MRMIDAAWWLLQRVSGFRYYGGGGSHSTKRHYLTRRLPFGFGMAVKFAINTTYRYEPVGVVTNGSIGYWARKIANGQKHAWQFRLGRFKRITDDIEWGRW